MAVGTIPMLHEPFVSGEPAREQLIVSIYVLGGRAVFPSAENIEEIWRYEFDYNTCIRYLLSFLSQRRTPSCTSQT